MDELLTQATAETDEVKPCIRVAKIDETFHWIEPYPEVAGRIWGVYVYDANRVVHCCEVTGSYELHFVESQTMVRVSDDIQMEMLDGDRDTPAVMYLHCGSLDDAEEIDIEHDPCNPYPKGGIGTFILFESYDGDSDAAIEEALEYARQCSV